MSQFKITFFNRDPKLKDTSVLFTTDNRESTVEYADLHLKFTKKYAGYKVEPISINNENRPKQGR